MERLVIESYAVFEGARITGLALTPRISMNGNLYPPEELKKADNIRVPLYWEHDTTKMPIGAVTFHYIPEKYELRYEGLVTDEKVATLLKHKNFHVSIGAMVDETKDVCGKENCYTMAMGMHFQELSIVEYPGIPESSLNIIERFREHIHVKEPFANYSDFNDCVSKNQDKEDPKAYCGSIKSKTEGGSGGNITPNNTSNTLSTPEINRMTQEEKPVETVQPVETVKEDCGCSKTVKPVEAQKEEQKTWIPNMDEINARFKEQQKMIDEVKQRINNPTQLNQLDAVIAADKQKRERQVQPIARVSTEKNGSFNQEDIDFLAKEMVESCRTNRGYSWVIDLTPEWANEHNYKKVQEAISFSGTAGQTVAASSDVFVLPGGKYLKSIRNLVRFKEIAPGDVTVNFYKGDIPNNGTITEGSDTSASTHTFTTVTLAANTVTGVAQAIKQADIENTPAELMNYLNQTARAEVLEAEATLVFDTAANAATPNLWINGNSGATLAGGDDVASMTMEPTSLLYALQNLETSGYDTSFGNAYCVLHPKALRELRGSTNLTSLVQIGDANITKTGQLTHLYGIELIPSTAVKAMDNTTNDTYRNVVGIKGHTFALGSKRELLLDLLKIPKQSAYDWTWSQRKNATTFDAASFIRISSAQ